MNYFQFKKAMSVLLQAKELRNANSAAPTPSQIQSELVGKANSTPSRGTGGDLSLARELEVLRLAGRELEALRIAQLAAAQKRCPREAWLQWAEVLVDLHRHEEAIQVLHNGAAELGCWELRMQAKLILPAVTASQSDMNQAHARVHESIHALADMPLPPNGDFAAMERALVPNFYLAYLGEPCVEEATAFGSFVQRVMHTAYPDYSIKVEPRRRLQGEKIRVGYATSYACFHSVMKCVAGWLLHADHDEMELHLFPLNSEQDWMTHYLASLVDHAHGPARDLETAARQIRGADLDVLIYPEVGMDPLTMRLSALQLAPVQCSTWGHPPTTGMPSIGYYISSDAMEPANAADHYTERLVTLPGIGVSVPFMRSGLPGKSRSDFGFSTNDLVYLCSQSLFKYLPRHDDVFARIAQSVDNAVFVFLASGYPAWVRTFQARLADSFLKHGLDPERHIRFVPSLPFDEFLSLNANCDIFLDNIGWSGANTALEAIAQDLPIVTLPGKIMRSRHCLGILQQLGVEETIARDVDDYIAIAIRLGLDHTWRLQVADKIRDTRHLLFDDTRNVRSLEAFCRWVAGSARSGDESLFKLWSSSPK